MNKSLQKLIYLFKLIYLIILKHFSSVSYVSCQVFCSGDGQAWSSGERCHELCWDFERMCPGTICTTDWSFLGEFLPSWSEDTDPPLFLELQWWTGALRWCASVSPTLFLHAFNLFQLQLLGWFLLHKELIQQLLVLLCQQFCEGGIQHWLKGGIGWRGRAGDSCQRSAYGGRRRDQCRGRKRRREDHGHRWHRSHTWWYSKRN